MSEMLSRPLVWWRDVPIDVESGLLTYLSKVWENDIYVVAAHDYESARKQCAWEVGAKGNVHLFTGESSLQENQHTLNALLRDNDTLHIFSGIRGGQRRYLDLLNKENGAKCVFVMESPSLYGTSIRRAIKRIAYPMMYSHYRYLYKGITCGLFAMGEDAVAKYRAYGWSNVHNFMYLPQFKRIDGFHEYRNTVKMLYIGRFDYHAKGVDILQQAIDRLPEHEIWQIDFVGGYGANKDEVIRWCENRKNVNYIGKWNSDEVVARMTEYDICIVPSRYDGWNMTPQQAIHAGIGCIITDHAGSQEIIRNSNAGMVVSAGSVDAIYESITMVLNKPELIENWRKKAKSYADRISTDAVGKYFVNRLSFSFGYSKEMIKQPW